MTERLARASLNRARKRVQKSTACFTSSPTFGATARIHPHAGRNIVAGCRFILHHRSSSPPEQPFQLGAG
jgi:hypothetical protein